ncbi:hypothetical protein BU24DRAFT_206802 [Aaosphaeria arxii CBS 175.79]|uniref:Mif2/CENP-C cupin domain-containing protein n=1 Tax=Aaosphaeria arxii CBS 175.79 TaxID=1450172 RepID=A0A6A5XWK1_9PLEO|nr:uncharacterized protein BU24DRAFT_206802 [Aaosphaeria arxii CBS 175.79]KAF2016624.1 hypothetical protein BU24DRAFT_206802 [Aaosphaeria arxii CBS 175.79]
MPVARKRENRENQFYNVGEQGRKTGIRLEDTGVRDEYGMEPISGIFSSPEKSPAKRDTFSGNATVIESESMDIDESEVPNLTPGRFLHRSRPNLPPPKSRSPIKTSLGSSPRRQSSMGPRTILRSSADSSDRATSHPAVSRRLSFSQDEASLQETPALSGSGTRRGAARSSIYDLEESPSRDHNSLVDESVVQAEITEIAGDEESELLNEIAEESFAGAVGYDTLAGADDLEDEDVSGDVEESEVMEESVEEPFEEALEEPVEEPVEEPEEEVVVKQPAKRGRKRKSDVMANSEPKEVASSRTKRRGPAAEEQPTTTQKGKKSAKASPPAAERRRSNRISEATEQEDSSILPAANDESMQLEEAPVAPKRRGRPPKATTSAAATTTASKKKDEEKVNDEAVFKKPKAVARGRPKATSKPNETTVNALESAPGRLVDALGNPLSEEEVDRISMTSTASRYGRGRSLSVFRSLNPDQAASKGRTGRHRLQPVNFWLNEHASYDRDGNLQSIMRNETKELPKEKRATRGRKGSKRTLAAVEEEEEDLEGWEQDEGVLLGIYKDFDTTAEVTLQDQIEEPIAWAQNGIKPVEVPGAEFKFTKLASAGTSSFFSWGYLALDKDGHKRSKNSRRMHMVFHVTKGKVEVQVDDNEFTINKGGLWQVPRGKSIHIFFTLLWGFLPKLS